MATVSLERARSHHSRSKDRVADSQGRCQGLPGSLYMPSNDTKKSRPRFEPFQGPNYTLVPDEVFDRLLPELTGAELKVLLYIIRRTFGFKKDADSISLAQMLN